MYTHLEIRNRHGFVIYAVHFESNGVKAVYETESIEKAKEYKDWLQKN